MTAIMTSFSVLVIMQKNRSSSHFGSLSMSILFVTPTSFQIQANLFQTCIAYFHTENQGKDCENLKCTLESPTCPTIAAVFCQHFSLIHLMWFCARIVVGKLS